MSVTRLTTGPRLPLHRVRRRNIGKRRVPKIIISNTTNLLFKTAICILLMSNHNSFCMVFDRIAYVYFMWKIYLYFSIGNGQPCELALCQLYRRTFVPYWRPMYLVFSALWRSNDQCMGWCRNRYGDWRLHRFSKHPRNNLVLLCYVHYRQQGFCFCVL